MTSDCIPVPHPDQLRSIHLDYNGHGTSINDVVIAVGATSAIALAIVLIVWFCCR